MSIRFAACFAAALAALSLSACGQTKADAGESAEDFSVGAADAPLTVIEYASVTCPACKAWHDTEWPAFKARMVDTGQVRFVFRELPTPPVELSVAGFLVARCASGDRYFDVLDALFARQQDLLSGNVTLLAVAREFGMNEESLTACMRNEAHLAAINANIDRARANGVSATPSFVLPDGTVLSGPQPAAALEQRLAAAQ